MTKAKQPIISANELIQNTKDIKSLLDTALTDTAILNRAYQVIGCSIIQHLAKHGDIHLMRRLFKDLEANGMNVNSMKEFMNKYAPVVFDEKGEVTYDKNKDVKLGEAMENAWWKAKKQAPYTPFIFADDLKKLLIKATKKLENPKEGDKVTQEEIDNARSSIVTKLVNPEALPDISDLADVA